MVSLVEEEMKRPVWGSTRAAPERIRRSMALARTEDSYSCVVGASEVAADRRLAVLGVRIVSCLMGMSEVKKRRGEMKKKGVSEALYSKSY